MHKQLVETRPRRNRLPARAADLVPSQPSLAARRLLAKYRLSLPTAELIASLAGLGEKEARQ